MLHFFYDREPFSDHAPQVLNLCEEKIIEGYTSPVITVNTYYLLRKTAKHEAVIDKLNQLFNTIDIVKMDRQVVVKALNSNFKDFKVALQYCSAAENKQIQIILTRNKKDFKSSELAVLTAETYLKGQKPSG